MPYLVMIDRLKSFLRNERKPAALFVIGHSFSDEHINATIMESLKANPAAVCFALQYAELSEYPKAVALAKNHANFNVLARDAAIIKRRNGVWLAKPATETASLNGVFELPEPERSSVDNEDEPRACRFSLGDFELFGGFVDEFTQLPVDEA
jgi:hypothetical protein